MDWIVFILSCRGLRRLLLLEVCLYNFSGFGVGYFGAVNYHDVFANGCEGLDGNFGLRPR